MGRIKSHNKKLLTVCMISEIRFKVEGRPPRKSGAQSCWSIKSKEWELIYKLRECAFEAKKLADVDDYFTTNTKITIRMEK